MARQGHRHHDYVPGQILVAGQTKAERDRLVKALLDDEQLKPLGFTLQQSDRGPDTVALLKADLEVGQELDFAAIRHRHSHTSPNYVITPMVHAKVLPINYPRPTSAPANLPPAADEEAEVTVVVIDSPKIDGTPLADQIETDDGDHVHLEVDVADGHASIGHRHDAVHLSDLHGTFVASIIRQREPRAKVRLHGLQNSDDDGFYSDWELACQLVKLGQGELPQVVNLSLGAGPIDGPAIGLGDDEKPRATEHALKQLRDLADERGEPFHVVAAAGNEGIPQLVYPAAFDGVYAVGAQSSLAGGRPRPARWSNGIGYDGVDYWAPGVSLIGATIFQHAVSFPPIDTPAVYAPEFADDLPMAQNENLDFDGWACWDGTSFATPVIAARIAKAIIDDEPLDNVARDFGSRVNTTGFPGGTFEAPLCG